MILGIGITKGEEERIVLKHDYGRIIEALTKTQMKELRLHKEWSMEGISEDSYLIREIITMLFQNMKRYEMINEIVDYVNIKNMNEEEIIDEIIDNTKIDY